MWIFTLKTGGFEKKTFWPLFFFNSVYFKKKNMFFSKKTEHVFFQENTNKATFSMSSKSFIIFRKL